MTKRFLFSSFALLFVTAAQAQMSQMNAFRNLGIGVEVGLMGAGVQLAFPLVNDHLVVVAGYNFYSLSDKALIHYDWDISASELNNSIERANVSYVDKYNKYHPNETIDRIESLPAEVTVNTSAKLAANAKLLFEYYPSDIHSFHFTAGVMIGSKEFITLTGVADPEAQARYTYALDVEKQLIEAGLVSANDPFVTGKLNYSVNNRTYAIQDRVEINARLTMPTVKPYLGMGWGFAIPGHRVGFQFEVGAWYHGKLKFEIDNEVKYDAEAVSDETADKWVKAIERIPVWPQMTFRITGRLF